MRHFACTCGSAIFFENSQCLSCGRELGWCPVCCSMTSLQLDGAGGIRCGNAACGAVLVKCHNYAIEAVCNRCIAPFGDGFASAAFCDYCQFNDTIPDLEVPGNREKWGKLELAKRRLLFTLDLLKLPYGTQAQGITPPLAFDFKADARKKHRWWWAMGQVERVYTGYADGKITINIIEADAVEREKARVLFQEAHRTVIGHFRHEIGHYYWQMLVQGQCEPACKAVFGDHENPTYSEAQERYYANGPAPHWRNRYISAYASMHPWEDFAETFATYLDVVSVLDTALNMGIAEDCDPTRADLDTMVDRYVQLGVVLNELNRSMGLIDLVPEIFGPAVVAKMRFVHDLVRRAARA